MEGNDENSSIVDLLYEDELDEETADRVRAGLDDPERAELQEYEELLDEIRAHRSEEDVPGEVHDSIMDAARKSAAGSSDVSSGDDERARPGRRSPAPRESSGRGIWGRLTEGSTITQLSVAAMALLAGGTALYILRGTVVETADQEAPAERASTAAESNPSPEQDEPAEKLAEESTNERPLESGEESANETQALPENKPEPSGAEDQRKEAAPHPDEQVKKDESIEKSGRARRQAQAPEDEGSSAGEKSDPKKKVAKKPGKKARAQAESPSKSSASSQSSPSGSKAGLDRSNEDESADDGMIDMFGASGSGSDESNADRETEDPSTADREQAAKREADDSSEVGDLAMGTGSAEQESAPSKKESESAPETDRDSDAPAPTERREETPEKKSEPERPKNESNEGDVPSSKDVERAFRQGEWRETIRRADAIIRTKSVDELQEPRILELKARALENLGQLGAAQQSYALLSDNYPNYRRASVERARERIAVKRRKRADRSEDEASEESSSESSDSADSTIEGLGDDEAIELLESE